MRKDAPQLPLAWTTAGPARSSPELAPQYSGRGCFLLGDIPRGNISSTAPSPLPGRPQLSREHRAGETFSVLAGQ